MATYYRTGVETYSIIGTADERDSLEGRIPDGSTYFAVDENMFYTFYDGQWYETLPEAARLYHDDVGTDTKPIKLVGGVATVVANELAEDSKVVHNTGNETVAGIKTFTSNVTCNKLSPSLSLKSTYQNTSINTYKGVISVTDIKDEAESNIILAIEQSKSDCEELMVRHYKPDRSGYHTLYLRAYQDHHLAFGIPYYPVDGSSNPLAIPNSAVMLSGNIAVDPRIVHTTGNETITGVKEFVTGINGAPTDWHRCWASSASVGDICLFAEVTGMDNGRYHYLEFIQSSNTLPAWGRLVFRVSLTGSSPVWAFRTKNTGNTPLKADTVVLVSDGSKLYIGARKSTQYGGIECRDVMEVLNGNTVSRSSSTVTFYAQANIIVLTDTTGYTIYEAVE